MPVFFILVIIGMIILWFLLSPVFGKIGELIIKRLNGIFSTDEINNKKEKESKKQ